MSTFLRRFSVQIPFLIIFLYSQIGMGNDQAFYEFYQGKPVSDTKACADFLSKNDNLQRIAYTVSHEGKSLDQKCLIEAIEKVPYTYFYNVKSFQESYDLISYYDALVLRVGLANADALVKLIKLLKNASRFERVTSYSKICLDRFKEKTYKTCAADLLYSLAYINSDEKSFQKYFQEGLEKARKSSPTSEFYFMFNELRFYAFRNNFPKVRDILRKMSSSAVMKTCYDCRANIIMARSYYLALQGKFRLAKKLLDTIDQSKLSNSDKEFLRNSYLEVYPYLYDFDSVKKIKDQSGKILNPPDSYSNPRLFNQLGIIMIISEYIETGKTPERLTADYLNSIKSSSQREYLKYEIDTYNGVAKDKPVFPDFVKYIESRINYVTKARKDYADKSKTSK